MSIWSYCQVCMDRTLQLFLRDEGKFEVYKCETCGVCHQYAVR